MEQEKVTLLGVSFDNKTKKEFVVELMLRIQEEKKTFVVTANPEIVMYAKNNPDYMNIIKKANYIAADGIGIIKGAKILGTPIVERVAGYELMLDLLNEANQHKLRVYFLGATEEVSVKTIKKVKQIFPSIDIVGSHNGYFDFSDQSIIEKVQHTNPDIVFVALGFPKQEQWIQQYMSTATKGLLMGVGGSFDVLSGKTKRAPKFFLKFHLEWLYRLIKQPSRMGRMMVLPRFILEIKNVKKGKHT